MRIKQFVIMMMIICGCVSAGCKNKYRRVTRQQVKAAI